MNEESKTTPISIDLNPKVSAVTRQHVLMEVEKVWGMLEFRINADRYDGGLTMIPEQGKKIVVAIPYRDLAEGEAPEDLHPDVLTLAEFHRLLDQLVLLRLRMADTVNTFYKRPRNNEF